MFIAALLFWPIVIAAGFYFVRRYVRAVERRATSDSQIAEFREQLLRLEESLESTRTDVERLQASQDFTQRLLSSHTNTESAAS